MWQFAEAVRGLADGCQELGIPVTGGNVSFYNQTGADADPPDPGGRRARRARRRGRRGSRWASPAAGRPDLPARRDPGGALRLGVGARRPRPPRRQPAAGRPGRRAAARPDCWPRPARPALLTAAHDLSDGGLAQALVEACLRRGVGAQVTLPDATSSPFVALFSESAGRVLVAVRRGHEEAFAALAAERAVPCTALGAVRAAGYRARRRGSVRPPARRAAHGPHRHAPRPLRLTPDVPARYPPEDQPDDHETGPRSEVERGPTSWV